MLYTSFIISCCSFPHVHRNSLPDDQNPLLENPLAETSNQRGLGRNLRRSPSDLHERNDGETTMQNVSGMRTSRTTTDLAGLTGRYNSNNASRTYRTTIFKAVKLVMLFIRCRIASVSYLLLNFLRSKTSRIVFCMFPFSVQRSKRRPRLLLSALLPR